MRAPTMTATRLVLVLSTMLSMLLATAAPALASDVDVDGIITLCVEGEPDGLGYTAELFQRQDETESATVAVSYRVDGEGDFAQIDELVLNAGNGYRASGSASGLDLDGERVTVRMVVTDSDNPKVEGDTKNHSADILPCDTGTPSGVTADHTACRDGAAAPAALLGNTTEETVTFTVIATVDGQSSTQTVDVTPRATDNRLRVPVSIDGIDDFEGRTMRLVVEVGGATELDKTFTIDCEEEQQPEPEAALLGDCTSTGGAIVASMDNPTDATVTFTVTINDEVVDTVDVAAGGSDEREYAVADGSHAATIEAGGVELASADLDIECSASPTADATTECFTDVATIEITLSNPDPTSATFVVTVDGEVVETVDITDSVVPVSVPVADGVHEVVVTADGVTIYDESINVLCTEEVFADAVAAVECTPDGGELVVTVDNPGDATTAQLVVDGEIVADVDVPSLELTDLIAPGLDDGPHDVEVIVGGETLLAETFDIDCVEVQGVVLEKDPPVDPAPDPAPAVAGEQLPNAGVESVTWVLFALLLVFFGGDLVLTELRTRLGRR